MFDIGGSELLVIGVVALIVVGPKDLPKMFHALGQFTAKARQMAREFQRAMENAADEAGAGDIARDLKSLNSMRNIGSNALSEASKRLESWDETKRASTAGLQPDPDAPLPGTTPEGSAESGDWASDTAPAAEPGPATKELAEKRKAQASARAEAAASAKEGAGKAPAKKTAAKSTAAKSTAAKSTTAKSGTAKTTATKTAATKTSAAKTTAAKSTAAKSTATKSTAAKPKTTKTAAKTAKPPKQGDA